MAKKAESTELYLRKNDVPEGGGQALERSCLFSDIMPRCAPYKPIKDLTRAGTCLSSTLEVNSDAYWDYSLSMAIRDLQGQKGRQHFILHGVRRIFIIFLTALLNVTWDFKHSPYHEDLSPFCPGDQGTAKQYGALRSS